MDQNELKKQAALAAIAYVQSGDIVGVGTGSTVNFFIEALAQIKGKIEGAIASSVATENRLKALGIPVLDLNGVGEIPLYVDGADEFNRHGYLIKGGGGALTREKIVAACAKKFVCIVDGSKQVEVLGQFPVPIEVIPMARSYVARQLLKWGGNPVYRAGVVTDNGHSILDIYHLHLLDPVEWEQRINNVTGVVCNGVFAVRGADEILVSTHQGIHVVKCGN